VHQRRVPKEAEHEEENERRDKCEEEFVPIHNFFLLSFYCCPLLDPRTFMATLPANVDSKFPGRKMTECAITVGLQSVAKTTQPHQPFLMASLLHLVWSRIVRKGRSR
jgi:hypothetical protein